MQEYRANGGKIVGCRFIDRSRHSEELRDDDTEELPGDIDGKLSRYALIKHLGYLVLQGL